MNEFGVHNGVEYEVSDTRAELKKIYFNNTNTGETFTRLLKNVTEERIKEYIDDSILFIHMKDMLLEYFRDRNIIVFSSSNVFDGREKMVYSKEINTRIKDGRTIVDNYEIEMYSTINARRKKYKATKIKE